MKRLIARIFRPLSSNKNTKQIFDKLYTFSLFGLYGDEWDFEQSGELTFLKLALSHLKDNELVFFDVGANVGEYSSNVIMLSKGKKITIHAFEPSYPTYTKYVEKFRGASNVIKNNFGLSDHRGEMKLFTTKNVSGLASLYTGEGKNFAGSETVSLRTLDDYCEEHAVEKIHFLKMDVEGHELAVLNGAMRTLSSGKISVIQFEFGARNLSSRTYFHDFYELLKNHFNLYRIVKNGLVKVEKYDYRLEVFGRVLNYVAILKTDDWNK